MIFAFVWMILGMAGVFGILLWHFFLAGALLLALPFAARKVYRALAERFG